MLVYQWLTGTITRIQPTHIKWLKVALSSGTIQQHLGKINGRPSWSIWGRSPWTTETRGLELVKTSRILQNGMVKTQDSKLKPQDLNWLVVEPPL